MPADADEICGRMVVLHGVAVAASRDNVVMVVIPEAMVDTIDAVEAARIVGSEAPAEGARLRHNSLCVALEKSPIDVLLCSNALVPPQLGNRRASTSLGHSCVGIRNWRRLFHGPATLATY